MWQAIRSGDPDPSSEIAQARLAITHGIRESVRALLLDAAGTNAIYRKNSLEHFRDIHASVQHVSGVPSNIEFAGQASGSPSNRHRLVARVPNELGMRPLMQRVLTRREILMA